MCSQPNDKHQVSLRVLYCLACMYMYNVAIHRAIALYIVAHGGLNNNADSLSSLVSVDQQCQRYPGRHCVLRLSLLIPGTLTAPHLLKPALCKHPLTSSRLLGTQSHDQNVGFDWAKFLEYLSPEWLWLLLAVAVSHCYYAFVMQCTWVYTYILAVCTCTLSHKFSSLLQVRD